MNAKDITYFISRDIWGVQDPESGKDLGKVKHNVVASGAIKWSAEDNLGQPIGTSYLMMDEAVAAVWSCR